jgi:hypothetical protein
MAWLRSDYEFRALRQGGLSCPASVLEAPAYVSGKSIFAINIVRCTHSQCVIQFPASEYHSFVQSVAAR